MLCKLFVRHVLRRCPSCDWRNKARLISRFLSFFYVQEYWACALRQTNNRIYKNEQVLTRTPSRPLACIYRQHQGSMHARHIKEQQLAMQHQLDFDNWHPHHHRHPSWGEVPSRSAANTPPPKPPNCKTVKRCENGLKEKGGLGYFPPPYHSMNDSEMWVGGYWAKSVFEIINGLRVSLIPHPVHMCGGLKHLSAIHVAIGCVFSRKSLLPIWSRS